MSDFEEKKKQAYKMLDEIEADANRLLDNIADMRVALETVKKNEDGVKWENEHDIEKGLKYIELFV